METLRLAGSPKDIGDGVGFPLRTISDNLPVLTADKKLLDKNTGRSIWKIGVSLCSGCKVGCIYCFSNGYSNFRALTSEEIVEEVKIVVSHNAERSSGYDETKVSFKQMGDPLVNPWETLKAIEKLHAMFPNFAFVVSTSGPDCNLSFFDSLNELHEKGIAIRLQFSCHTTSDSERAYLSPQVSMLTFAQIAGLVKRWNGSPVTLNFVLMKGFEYDVGKLVQMFDPKRVFIKVNYIDKNSRTGMHNLEDIDDVEVSRFTKELQRHGFNHAYRNR